MADALLDRVQLGLCVPLQFGPVEGAYALRMRFHRLGLLPNPPRRGRLGPIVFRGPLEIGQGPAVEVSGRLCVSHSGGAATIAGKSHIVLNLMRGLRAVVADPCPRASDGDDNLIGECGDHRELLGWQLRTAGLVVAALLCIIADAAGVDVALLRGRVWVQQAEVCRDRGQPGAEALISRLSRVPIPGTRSDRRRVGNGLCVSWTDGTGDRIERKLYAKRRDLFRAEVAVRNRPGVRSMVSRANGAASEGLEPAGVAAELAAVARAAVPYLEEIERFVASADCVDRSGSEDGAALVVALAPLALLASLAPPGAPGRPRGECTVALAKRAVGRLLDEGSFDARGLHSADAVLIALQRLAAAGVLEAGTRHRRVFTVAPRFERARQTFLGGGVPPGPVPLPDQSMGSGRQPGAPERRAPQGPAQSAPHRVRRQNAAGGAV